MTDKATPARRYNFSSSKTSGLSAIANKMWDQGKQEFGEQTKKPIILERKGLGDVLDKIKKEQGTAATTDASSSATPTFVFGQKLSERVLLPTHATTSSDIPAKSENIFKGTASEKKSTFGSDATNGDSSSSTTAERLRADAEQHSKEEAKEHERQLASTSVIEVKTGEENDHTIHQFSCKIHSFDRTKAQWVERGLSNLKINRIEGENTNGDDDNDDDGWSYQSHSNNDKHYRIVARTFGTMKLVINSPIYADMVIEKVDERRVKITAVGAEGTTPQIFLLTSNLAKTDSIGEQMYTALLEARSKAKKNDETRKRKRPVESGEGDEGRTENKKAIVEDEKKEEDEGKKEEEETKEDDKKEDKESSV